MSQRINISHIFQSCTESNNQADNDADSSVSDHDNNDENEPYASRSNPDTDPCPTLSNKRKGVVDNTTSNNDSKRP